MASNRPTTQELLEAIEEFLSERTRNSDSGELDFKMLIAYKSLGIVRRELEATEARDQEVERLQTLLQAHECTSLDSLNKQLATALRNREIPLDSPALKQHLLLSTIEKLKIDNPNYSALKRRLSQ